MKSYPYGVTPFKMTSVDLPENLHFCALTLALHLERHVFCFHMILKRQEGVKSITSIYFLMLPRVDNAHLFHVKPDDHGNNPHHHHHHHRHRHHHHQHEWWCWCRWRTWHCRLDSSIIQISPRNCLVSQTQACHTLEIIIITFALTLALHLEGCHFIKDVTFSSLAFPYQPPPCVVGGPV